MRKPRTGWTRSGIFAVAVFLLGGTFAQVAVAQQSGAAQAWAAEGVVVPPINFDVVSVKLDTADDTAKPGLRMSRDGDSITYQNLPLFYIVIFSNNFHRFDRVYGMPEWTKKEKYDVTAKVAVADVPEFRKLNAQQKLTLFQKVLADRFKLKFHRELREMPVYDLIVAKGGVKMTEAKPGETYPDGFNAKYGQSMLFTSYGRLEAQGSGMGDLALFLSGADIGREVLDKTGLTGKYDFTLHWARDLGAGSPAGGAASSPPLEDAGPSVFTAIQEQLGLKLEPAKGMVECFVVDHVEPPTGN
jgi:uncharacterized protein (TIGR03435 family)